MVRARLSTGPETEGQMTWVRLLVEKEVVTVVRHVERPQVPGSDRKQLFSPD